jgi:hypothetical protein
VAEGSRCDLRHGFEGAQIVRGSELARKRMTCSVYIIFKIFSRYFQAYTVYALKYE